MLNSTQIIGNVDVCFNRDRVHVLHDLYPDETMENKVWRAYYNGWIAGRIDLAHRYNITDESGEP
jgi:hypothetical protein